jgi:hypothetical protein
VLLTISAASFAQQTAPEFRWQGVVTPGRSVEIKGVNGNIEAAAATGQQVEVVAERRARRSNPEDVRIEVVEHADGVTICAVYPTAAGREPNECQPGSGGRMNTQNNDTNVRFTVRVPAGVNFVGRTVNGDVGATDLSGNIVAYTVNGGIEFSTSGYAEGSTVNGSIRGTLGRADWSDPLEFHTVNGGITLTLPDSVSADVRATTVNGGISTDFPLTMTGTFGPRRLSGAIGGGGRELRLETVNGSIALKRQ